MNEMKKLSDKVRERFNTFLCLVPWTQKEINEERPHLELICKEAEALEAERDTLKDDLEYWNSLNEMKLNIDEEDAITILQLIDNYKKFKSRLSQAQALPEKWRRGWEKVFANPPNHPESMEPYWEKMTKKHCADELEKALGANE